MLNQPYIEIEFHVLELGFLMGILARYNEENKDEPMYIALQERLRKIIENQVYGSKG